MWQGLQDELAALSSNSRHQHVVGTTHESLDAQATSAAISEVIAAVRSGQPVARWTEAAAVRARAP